MQADIDDIFPDYVICNICSELLYMPITLSCGHTFCKECSTGHKCPECRAESCESHRIDINRAFDALLQHLYPAQYQKRKADTDFFILQRNIANWFPNSSVYVAAKRIINDWYHINGTRKSCFYDIFEQLDKEFIKSYTDYESLFYAIWLKYISETYGKTVIPIAVYPHSDIPSKDLREINLNQYSRLYNKTYNKQFIAYIKDAGVIVKPEHLDADYKSIIIDFVSKNFDAINLLYNVESILDPTDDDMPPLEEGTIQPTAENISELFRSILNGRPIIGGGTFRTNSGNVTDVWHTIVGDFGTNPARPQ